MDLVDALKSKIDALEDGEHILGLKAVLRHIETAFSHLARGQKDDNESAFTDAIYRTNQAFEGSVKEAYRTLTGKDPSETTPAKIEAYLEKEGLLRDRVLAQLTTYRREWRNPSTHDYKLDFDESESFLAIISVSALACLLLDLIAERLAYVRSQTEADAQRDDIVASLAPSAGGDLHTRITALLKEFCSSHIPVVPADSMLTETQAIGALHGFLSSVAPELNVATEVQVGPSGSPFRADLMITQGDRKIAIELKRRMTKAGYGNGIAQVHTYLLAGAANSGVLLVLPEPGGEVEIVEAIDGASGGIGRVTAIVPSGALSKWQPQFPSRVR
ncbi:hypothetical protein [Stenotrophomonas sp. S39]|uniref:hypothetical protein n=1 Tax=Stenotrophomonas sp. S39 TaxID=2767451 RepID=UPI00190D4909|nr:hypothetical protein [Stenotrophomonas sp. S39]MBK0053070.1 hypothetical protein [Stenotrophomonas sp. S39]